MENGQRLPIPRFTPYGTYELSVNVDDVVGNNQTWTVGGPLDLCGIGTCQLLNRSENAVPDTDMDGVPDDADNCPDDMNADQGDADLDLIGDACDPFPNDRDNEKAQCFEDLDLCLEQPPFEDEDADGEHDQTDLCPGTADGMAVDTAGCSIYQFCASFPTQPASNRRTCRRADWQNDEPEVGRPMDCAVVRTGRGERECLPWVGAGD